MTGLALYIHWPFCDSKCPYCDFNSHVRASVDQDEWRTALLADLAHESRLTSGQTLTSIFFGGGTPSLMPPKTVSTLIEAAESHWSFDADIEIALEANPSFVEAARFADLARAGINRVSLGLQSLDDDNLRFLGRAHDVHEGLTALDTAQSVFARTSLDLIYALPGQSADHWETQLGRALSFGTEHLSLYQLTIEPGTHFATLAARGELDETEPDHGAALYELTQSLAETAGRPAYEISNYARPGSESRHNLSYWRYQPYTGVGPGAHGRRGDMATLRHKTPENWLSAVARNGHGLQSEDRLSDYEQGAEMVIMGLRLAEGIARNRLPPDLVDESAVTRLIGHEMLERCDDRLVATAQGRLVLNSLIAEIVANEMVAA